MVRPATEPVRTVDAAERFRAALNRGGEHHHIVVIGGGYIGIEMAEALVQRDIPSTLVEAMPQLMSTLDADMAAHVQEGAEAEGIDVRLSDPVTEIAAHRKEASALVDELRFDEGPAQ